jgi:hypothetical protein
LQTFGVRASTEVSKPSCAFLEWDSEAILDERNLMIECHELDVLEHLASVTLEKLRP